jgi:hypothetical protein
MASIKNAASKEKMAMNDEIAYNGTLVCISMGQYEYSWLVSMRDLNSHDHDPNNCALEGRFTIILQLKRDRHDRYRRSYPSAL